MLRRYLNGMSLLLVAAISLLLSAQLSGSGYGEQVQTNPCTRIQHLPLDSAGRQGVSDHTIRPVSPTSRLAQHATIVQRILLR